MEHEQLSAYTKDLQIIQAGVPHINLLCKLGYETFYESFAADNDPNDIKNYLEEAFNPDQIRKEILEANSLFLLACFEDQAVGYARIRESGEGTEKLIGRRPIELQRIYVLKEFSGNKIGSLLLEKCVSIARSKGYDTIWLGVWEHNLKAIRFYKKWGFEKFSDHKFKLGRDIQTDILMKKEI